jgi:hypothetical protein
VDDLELITKFRSEVQTPDATRTARARRALRREFDGTTGRSRLRPALGALVAAPLVAAIGLAVAGVFGGGGTSIADAAIIHRADVALTAGPGKILYTHVAGGGFGAQTWQLTSPPYSFVGSKGPSGGHAPEEASNGTTASWWDPATNTIHEQPAPTMPQGPSGNPLAQIKSELHAGRARVLGTATVDGTATYKIQFEDKNGFDAQSLVAYVDQSSYRPLLLSDPQRNGQVVQLKVLALEYLPATPANLRLLSLTARHPDAKVVRGGASPYSGTK